MRKVSFIIMLLLATTQGITQKIEAKKGVVYVDGTEYLTYDKQFIGIQPHITFYNINGEEVVYASANHYVDSWNKNYSNYGSRVHYFEINIYGMEDFCEIDQLVYKNNAQNIGRMLYKSGIVALDGTIDNEKSKNFIKTRGKKHSEMKKSQKGIWKIFR